MIFYINKGDDCCKDIINSTLHRCSEDVYSSDASKTKFYNDCCFDVDESFIIYNSGVILNSKNLYTASTPQALSGYIKENYVIGNAFFQSMRGNFQGLIFDIDQKEGIIYADHFANKPWYYYENEQRLIVASTVTEIVDLCKKAGIDIHMDTGGAYCMLVNAFMHDNYTLVSEIKKLRLGHYLKITGNKVEEIKYWEMSNKATCHDSIEEAIEKVDELFLKAVKLQIEKNMEYGYHNYAPLSAGLDSRMTVFALNRLKAENIVTFTYSQSGQYDNIVPMQISSYLGNKWIYKSLDNGLDMLNIKEAVDVSDGLIYYLWPAQLGDFMHLINTDRMGIVHTGVIGDAVLGSILANESEFHLRFELGNGSYSKKLLRELKNNILLKERKNRELGMMYNRAINGAAMGYSTTFSLYTEACSPFMDVDFFEYCFSLPHSYRFRHNLYYKWVISKYPVAARYDHNGVKISSNDRLVMLGKSESGIRRVFDEIVNSYKVSHSKPLGMNPLQRWYDTIPEIEKSWNEFIKESSTLKKIDEKIYKDAIWLYKEGDAWDKSLVISLIGSVEKFFG